MDVDGSNQARISKHPAREVMGMWGPDGSKFVYSSTFMGYGEIWVIDVGGAKETLLYSQLHLFN
jgi:Tol biopolymer transport system component